jgi:hypothetical protein
MDPLLCARPLFAVILLALIGVSVWTARNVDAQRDQ